MLPRRILILLAALSLAACGGAPLAEQATAPTLPTAAPSRETFAPPPSPPPATTPLPPATAQATELPPTQPSAPTAVPPTQPPATAQATAVPPTQPPAPTALAPTQAATAQATASSSSEILFLRKGALIALNTSTRKERQLAEGVIDFAASPDGAQIALLRAPVPAVDLWVVRRDGGGLRQLTNDGGQRVEAVPNWAPDSSAIVYASSDTSDYYTRTWPSWSEWCEASEVHAVTLADGAAQSFGPGCDPAFSPDGKRIAYAALPTMRQEGGHSRNAANSIRLINRLGQNGWNFATADGGAGNDPAKSGLLVYAPAWSPDGKQIVYHRYLGYQALVDMDLTEIAGSFDGKGQPLDSGAGWLLPARFAPDRQSLAITENNPGDARGFGGYDSWAVTVTRLGGTREIALPTGTLTAVGQRVERLARGQAAAWSPDGATLAVELPPGWKPNLAPDEPVNAEGQPGEIWRWQPGSAPSELLVKNVDFASPLAWLP